MEVPPLFLLEERIKTFKKWPFSNKDKCNVRNMAEAGFYSVATGNDDIDAAKCFLCGKELDGWESTDDPWAEHKSHAGQCAFVQIGKIETGIKMTEFLSIAEQYLINSTKNLCAAAKEKIGEKEKNCKRKVVSAK